MLWYNHSFAQMCLFIGTDSQMAHEPLVISWVDPPLVIITIY